MGLCFRAHLNIRRESLSVDCTSPWRLVRASPWAWDTPRNVPNDHVRPIKLESAFGEDSCASKEDKIVVPLRKDPEVEKKKKPEHEHESEFGEEKESKERKEKALKEIEMGNAAYKATVLSKCDHLLVSLATSFRFDKGLT
ncbi:hypothetical protein YC2023_013962 [Brassica napus]